jgi:hypothetical protein
MAELLLNGAKVGRAIYLGGDDALEETVSLWAESLVGGDPSDERLWQRALEVIDGGTPDAIDLLVRGERARLRLKSLEGLPGTGERSIEMVGDRVAVLIHDKARLDEEDIYAATFLVFGKGDAPLARAIGTRWFLTPGPIGSTGGGGLVLDDSGDDVVATFYGPDGQVARTEPLSVARATSLRVQGNK